MLDFPPTSDPLVAALQRLLKTKGGHVVVGDLADVNDQSLYQIAYLKPHSKTGKLKSVGPSIRKRLDRAFPGWLDGALSVREPEPRYAVPDLAEQLADAVVGLPPARWVSVRAQLDTLPAHPEMRDEVVSELRALLSAPSPGKRTGTHG